MAAVSRKAKANKSKSDKESYRWYREHGICPRCKKRFNKPGRVHCEVCLAKMVRSKNKRDPGGENRKVYDQDRRARLKAKGLCPVCGKRKPAEGRIECAICRQNKWDSQRKFYIHKRTLEEGEHA
jgi:predicted amidophosphoribosyltransferase